MKNFWPHRIWFFVIPIVFSCGKKPINFEKERLNPDTEALLIGMSVSEDQTIWASGTKATLLRSTDMGENWEVFQYAVAGSLQFRDVQAIDRHSAYVLSAGKGSASQILIFDEEKGWEKVFQMEDSSGFLDALESWPNRITLAYGDAVDEQLYILKNSKENAWNRVSKQETLVANEREGGFASSGTNIAVEKGGKAWIGTGANGSARVLYTEDYGEKWESITTPMITGEAAGITSVRKSEDVLFITGGDLTVTKFYTPNLFYSKNNGREWIDLAQPVTKGAFYGSAISKIASDNIFIVCGPNGADVWLGDQKKWFNISTDDLWNATFINPTTAILSGRGGKMWRVTFK